MFVDLLVDYYNATPLGLADAAGQLGTTYAIPIFSRSAREPIDETAAAVGKSPTEFVLESAASALSTCCPTSAHFTSTPWQAMPSPRRWIGRQRHSGRCGTS